MLTQPEACGKGQGVLGSHPALPVSKSLSLRSQGRLMTPLTVAHRLWQPEPPPASARSHKAEAHPAGYGDIPGTRQHLPAPHQGEVKKGGSSCRGQGGCLSKKSTNLEKIYFFERQSDSKRESDRERDPPSPGSLNKFPFQPMLSQAEEPCGSILVSHIGSRDYKYLGHYLLSPRVRSGRLLDQKPSA